MNRLATALVTTTLLATMAGTAAFALSPSTPTNGISTADAVLFGMDAGSIDAQTAAGVAPDIGTFWVGPWTLTSGWGGPDGQMRSMRDQGITPALHLYYWGDDISQSCLQNGCWSNLHNTWKDPVGWQRLTDQLVDHLQIMNGEPVMIFLETEFNKADVQTYEPLDAMLAEKAQQVKAGYPQANVVLSLGSWNTPAWSTWDQAAAASDAIGLQGMRGSTRDSATHYDALYADTLRNVQTARDMFGQPIVLQDIALSTYPEPEYVTKQADGLQAFFDGMTDLKAAGVEAIVYRSWRDVNMDPNNYYGEAERHWGLAYQDGTLKPSGHAWIDGVNAERASPAGGAPPQTPEAFTADFAPSTNNNAWWVEVRVVASSAPAAVHARHNEGPWIALPATSWGSWAKSFNAPPGGTMTFRATDAYGQQASAAFDWLQPANQAPKAAWSASIDGLTVHLDASGSSDADGDVLQYSWQLGDGRVGSGMTMDHTYALEGVYTITLTVNDGLVANRSTANIEVIAPNRAPVAAFNFTVDKLTVHASSTSSDPDGDLLSHRWTFSDGAVATGKTVSHHFVNPGEHTITLRVDDGEAQTTVSRTAKTTAPAFAPVITPADGNNAWWVEYKVPGATSVQVRHNEGIWQTLNANTWGTWSKSFNAPPGGTMEVLATDAYGQTAKVAFAWLPEKVWTPTITPSQNSNTWWVEVRVDAERPATQVLARQGSGAWVQLESTSWGTWAKSFAAPLGTMTFQAIDGYGNRYETTVEWLQPDVTFTAKTASNQWWVEVDVDAGSHVQQVEAKVKGTWYNLEPTAWDTWALKVHAKGDVVFRATTDAGTATSAPIHWG